MRFRRRLTSPLPHLEGLNGCGHVPAGPSTGRHAHAGILAGKPPTVGSDHAPRHRRRRVRSCRGRLLDLAAELELSQIVAADGDAADRVRPAGRRRQDDAGALLPHPVRARRRGAGCRARTTPCSTDPPTWQSGRASSAAPMRSGAGIRVFGGGSSTASSTRWYFPSKVTRSPRRRRATISTHSSNRPTLWSVG